MKIDDDDDDDDGDNDDDDDDDGDNRNDNDDDDFTNNCNFFIRIIYSENQTTHPTKCQ